jgi:hypothetical protein
VNHSVADSLLTKTIYIDFSCILFFDFTFCGLYHKYWKWFDTSDWSLLWIWFILLCSHYIYLTFEGGSKSANGGPYLPVDLDPRGGSISTSRSTGAPARNSNCADIYITFSETIKYNNYCHNGRKASKGNILMY